MLRKSVSAVLLVSVFAILGAASAAAAAEDCKPPCWKDPYTGKIICGTPCP